MHVLMTIVLIWFILFNIGLTIMMFKDKKNNK